MKILRPLAGIAAVVGITSTGFAAFSLDYTVDAGGTNTNPLNGLSARATYNITGTTLSIYLENTSTGVPIGFDASDSLLVSLGFSLPDTYLITVGDSAVIGSGDVGIGSWSGLLPGDSVADQWVWTNDGSGDLLAPYNQVITTSSGLGGATATHFLPGTGNIDGPYGGIAGIPPVIAINPNQPAVSNGILFTMTLNAALTESALFDAVSQNSIVEFGSDVQYLTPPGEVVPEPHSLALGFLGVLSLLALRRVS